MSLVFCGTESPDVLSLKLPPDGKVEITQRLPVSSNPLALKYGSPGGIAVEWVTWAFDSRTRTMITYRIIEVEDTNETE